jgi:hypothetical protein
MSQRSLIWPLGVMMVALIIIVSALTSPTAPSAAPARQGECEPGNSAYPACFEETQVAKSRAETGDVCDPGSSAYPVCATETAEAEDRSIEETSAARQTDVAAQNDDNDDDDTTSDNNSSTTNNNTQDTATPTATRTATRTPTSTFEVDEDETEAEPTNTPGSTRQQATATPTSTPILDTDVLICVPGVPVPVEGQGPRNAALLLYFDGRAVGGTTSDSRGTYALQLIVGEERPGDYPLEVQVRGTRELVEEFTCRVPGGGTPTPTATEIN